MDTYPIFKRLKCYSEMSYFIFKSKVTYCGPQYTVLNISKFYIPSFCPAFVKDQVRLKIRHMDSFQPSNDCPTREHIIFPFPAFPQCVVLIHQPASLVSIPAWPSLSFGFATPTLNICNKTYCNSIERVFVYILYSLRKLHNFSLSSRFTT